MRHAQSLETTLLMHPEFLNYEGGDTFIFNGKIFYRKELLGSGGFSNVYCFEANDHTKVAVKIERSPYKVYSEGQAFQKEALWYQRIHGLGLFAGDAKDYRSPHYVLMPYFPGKTLNKIVHANEHELFYHWIKTADAANTFHTRYGAVHGDIKPDNIMVTDHSVKIVDFGLMMGPREKRRLELLDTPFYRQRYRQYPPEAFESDIKPMTAHSSQDIYALGILLKDLFSQFLSVNLFYQPSVSVIDTVNDVHKNLSAHHPHERWSIAKGIFMLALTFFSKIPRHIWIENIIETNYGLHPHKPFLTQLWRDTSALAIAIRVNELMDEQDELETIGNASPRKAEKIVGLQKMYSDIQIKNPEQFGVIIDATKNEFPELMAGIFSRRTKTLVNEMARAAMVFH
jgi:serine/threonine protein kinase